MAQKTKSSLREWLEAITLALIFVFIVRGFLFDLFAISSSSMEQSLLTGDFVVVNKISYGARLPITPLSFPFMHQFFPNSRVLAYSSKIELPYWRFPGPTEINRGDVVVFNYPVELEHPIDQRTYFIKRCVALPGDTLLIKNKTVNANGKIINLPSEAQFNFKVTTTNMGLDWDQLHELDIREGGPYEASTNWKLTMTRNDAEEVSQWSHITGVEELNKSTTPHDYIFPYSPLVEWDADNFGPLIVPKKGLTVDLTPSNLIVYQNVITAHEHNTLEVSDSAIFINGAIRDKYTFEQDYYFAMGDNRHNSSDSRYWGFLPEDHVVGKASIVLFSSDKNPARWWNKIRWNRFFMSIE